MTVNEATSRNELLKFIYESQELVDWFYAKDLEPDVMARDRLLVNIQRYNQEG